jgi:hypothetical protein
MNSKFKKKLIVVATMLSFSNVGFAVEQSKPAQPRDLGDAKVVASQLRGDHESYSKEKIFASPFAISKAAPQRSATKLEAFKDFDISEVLKDGAEVTVVGRPKQARGSLHLTINGNQLEGHSIDHQKGVAVEYKTSRSGRLIATDVPIEKYVPDLSPRWIEATKRAKNEFKTVSKERILKRFDLESKQWVASDLMRSQAPHLVPFNNHDLLKLQSKPNAQRVIYLNFTNPDPVENTKGVIKELPVLKADGTPNRINVAMKEDRKHSDGRRDPIEDDRFIDVSREDIYKVWQIVASAFSAFDVNITTDVSVYQKTSTKNKHQAMFFNHGCTSFASLNKFGTGTEPAHMCMDSDKDPWYLGVGYTVAHELGHSLGLNHQGDAADRYASGLSDVKWVPVMGNYWKAFKWDEPLVQWTKGEYPNAVTEGEEDLQDDIVTIRKKMPNRADDISSSGKSLVVKNGSISSRDNFGIVEHEGDTDKFTFNVAVKSTLNLTVDAIEMASLLDVRVKIYDSKGKVVADNNSSGRRYSTFSGLKLEPGKYVIEVKGGHEENEDNIGFPVYSSIGFYALSGTLAVR